MNNTKRTPEITATTRPFNKRNLVFSLKTKSLKRINSDQTIAKSSWTEAEVITDYYISTDWDKYFFLVQPNIHVAWPCYESTETSTERENNYINVNGKKKIRSPLKDWSGRRLRALHSLILLRRLDTSERTLDLVISKLLEVLNSKTLKIKIVTSQPAALSSSPLKLVNLKEWDTSSPPLPLLTSLLVN